MPRQFDVKPGARGATLVARLLSSHNKFQNNSSLSIGRSCLPPPTPAGRMTAHLVECLNEVDAHCAAVLARSRRTLTFLDETLRGFVLHLGAHFQGYCRDLYTECSQIWIAAIPAGLQATAQAQFSARLALEKGNPSYDNIKRDFQPLRVSVRFAGCPPGGTSTVTDLGQLNAWRNKAAHQGTQPLGGGVPAALTLPLVRGRRASCDGLAASLDGIMRSRVAPHHGVAPGEAGQEGIGS